MTVRGRALASRPLVSVLLPVYNGEEYLREAIESILSQTLTDFELVVINDGSTDRSREIVEACNDDRIVLIDRPHHGLVAALNYGLGIATGKYIARMDQDDRSRCDRLVEEAAFLEANPDVTLIGSAFELIDPRGRSLGVHKVLTRDEDIRRRAFYANPFGHGTIMIRKDALVELGGYREEAWPVEDYDLWIRVMQRYRVANLPEVHYTYLVNPAGISMRHTVVQTKMSRQTRLTIWKRLDQRALTWREVIDGAGYYRNLGASVTLVDEFRKDQLILPLLLARRGHVRSASVNFAAAIWLNPLTAIGLLWRMLVGRMRALTTSWSSSVD